MTIKVGDVVDYYSVVGDTEPYLRAKVWQVLPEGIPSCRKPILWLEGKGGCFLASHCRVVSRRGRTSASLRRMAGTRPRARPMRPSRTGRPRSWHGAGSRRNEFASGGTRRRATHWRAWPRPEGDGAQRGMGVCGKASASIPQEPAGKPAGRSEEETMQQATGRFISDKEMEGCRKNIDGVFVSGPIVGQRAQELPALRIGEIVEIKGVKFEVRRIWGKGKLLLKMLAIPAVDGPR